MSSRARRVKSLPSTPHEDIGYFHREHRSRKNRKSFYGRKFAIKVKEKLEEIWKQVDAKYADWNMKKMDW